MNTRELRRAEWQTFIAGMITGVLFVGPILWAFVR